MVLERRLGSCSHPHATALVQAQDRHAGRDKMQLNLQFRPVRLYVANMPEHPSSLILPLSSPRIPPHHATRVAQRAKQGALDVKAICISGAGTPGGAADWIVNDIEIEGRSQLKYKNLTGALFGTKGVASGRGQTSLSLSGLDTVEREHEFALVVTYVGSNSEGAPFFGSAMGTASR